MICDHKFVDSKVCLKCGVSFEHLKAPELPPAEAAACWKCGAVQNPDQANCDHRYGAHGDTCVKCGKGAY